MFKKGVLANDPAWLQVFIALIVFLGCFGLVFFIALLVAVPLFGLAFTEIVSAAGDFHANPDVRLLRYIQVTQSIGLFIVPPFVLSYMLTGKPLRFLEFKKEASLYAFIIAGATILFSAPLINYLVLINDKLQLPDAMRHVEQWMKDSEQTAEKITKLFLETSTMQGLLFNIFMIGLLPAIGEEMAFRGILQKILIKGTGSNHAGVILASLIFSAIHFQFYGFLARFVLGLYMGYLFVWSKNIWYPIGVHFINNTLAVIFYYLYYNGKISLDIDKLGTTSGTGYTVVISFMIICPLVYLTYKHFKASVRHPY